MTYLTVMGLYLTNICKGFLYLLNRKLFYDPNISQEQKIELIYDFVFYLHESSSRTVVEHPVQQSKIIYIYFTLLYHKIYFIKS